MYNTKLTKEEVRKYIIRQNFRKTLPFLRTANMARLKKRYAELIIIYITQYITGYMLSVYVQHITGFLPVANVSKR